MARRAAVSVVLDTCALLALADGTLPPGAASALRHAPEAYVSTVSAWEVAIKVAGGKLRLKAPPAHWFLGLVERYGLREATLNAAVATTAAALPPLHRDPFDRAIAALAQQRGLTVLTPDKKIRQYSGVTTLW